MTEGAQAAELSIAEQRQMWRESPEYRRIFWIGGILVIAIAVIAAAVATYVYFTQDAASRGEAAGAAAFLTVLLGLYIGGPLFFVARQRLTQDYQDNVVLGRAQLALEKADEAFGEDTEFSTLWHATHIRLDYYHRIATNQAERSFFYAQAAAVVGFAVLVLTSVVAAFASSAVASISSAAVGVAAGALGGYSGKTFMKSQELASSQLQAYFRQPLQFSNFLAAERLLDQVDASDRGAAAIHIIEAMAGGSTHDAA